MKEAGCVVLTGPVPYIHSYGPQSEPQDPPQVLLPVEPCSRWLHTLGERPMSPIAEELRAQLSTNLLIDKNQPDFAERFLEAGRKHGSVVVLNETINAAAFRLNYDVLAEVFAQDRDWLRQFGFPGPGKDDRNMPAETEVSVSAHSAGFQANVFQFIHRVATG